MITDVGNDELESLLLRDLTRRSTTGNSLPAVPSRVTDNFKFENIYYGTECDS